MGEKPLLDKLGVKPGMLVSVLGVDAPWFIEDLRARGADVTARQRRDSDLIFLACDTREELDRIAGLEPYLRRNGAVWVITRKGSREANQNDAMRAGLAAGLVDNKIASFSDTHSAIRLVIPVARR